MQNRRHRRFRPLIYVLGAGALIMVGASAAHYGLAQTGTRALAQQRAPQIARPLYDLRADIDTEFAHL